jgi:hypothetical protein
MLSRRKLFGWGAALASAVGLSLGSASSASAHVNTADQRTSKTDLARERARLLAQPFVEANQRSHAIFDLDAWVDNLTDNVLLKAYRRINMDQPVGQRGPEIGLGCAIPRRIVWDGSSDELDSYINEAWTTLTAAIHGQEIPPEWRLDGKEERVILGMPSMRGHAGSLTIMEEWHHG